jgi:hypothetical protein
LSADLNAALNIAETYMFASSELASSLSKARKAHASKMRRILIGRVSSRHESLSWRGQAGLARTVAASLGVLYSVRLTKIWRLIWAFK